MKCNKCDTKMYIDINQLLTCSKCGEVRLIIDGPHYNGIGVPNQKLDIKKPRLSIKQKITQFLLWLLWKFADDITTSHSYLGDLYDDVPEELDGVYVKETYIYEYYTSKRNKIVKWLDE